MVMVMVTRAPTIKTSISHRKGFNEFKEFKEFKEFEFANFEF